MAMARRIHTAKKRSSQPSPLNAETLSGVISFSICCLSVSSGTIEGGAVDISSSEDAALEWKVFLGHFNIFDRRLVFSLRIFFCKAEWCTSQTFWDSLMFCLLYGKTAFFFKRRHGDMILFNPSRSKYKSCFASSNQGPLMTPPHIRGWAHPSATEPIDALQWHHGMSRVGLTHLIFESQQSRTFSIERVSSCCLAGAPLKKQVI